MMSTALASVRPRTSRRLRMRDIPMIYADSNSADFADFKNRLLLKWSVQTQQERDRQTRQEQRRQQERERRARPRLILA